MVDNLENIAPDWQNAVQTLRVAGQEHTADIIEIMAEEIKRLRAELISFCLLWATQYARDYKLPDRHFHPAHYDVLVRCGARVDDFIRADEATLRVSGERAP